MKRKPEIVYGVRLIASDGHPFLAYGGPGIYTAHRMKDAHAYLKTLRIDHGVGIRKGSKVVKLEIREVGK